MTYEYYCSVCDTTFDIEQAITDDPLKECPRCRSHRIKRVIAGGTNFVLKGDGWGKDLYSKNVSNKKE